MHLRFRGFERKFNMLLFLLALCNSCRKSHKEIVKNELNKDETALIAAYKQAPTKNLKMQILSIYALQYSSSKLKEMHAPFENLINRQIKKARAHAKTVGNRLV